jgi:hypothetical protein
MAMAHHGVHKTPWEICTYIGTCTAGVGEEQLVKAAKHFGFSQAGVHEGVEYISRAYVRNISAILHIQVVANKYPLIYPSNKPAYTAYTGGHYIEGHGIHCDAAGNRVYYIINDPGHAGLNDVHYTRDSMTSAWG